jgi:hypothetical protein
MKKYFALPLAVVFVAACSDSSTAPSATDLAPSYAKPAPPPPTGCTTCTVNDFYNFEGVSTASSNTSIGTDIQLGAAGSADAPTVITAPNGTEHFVGRFSNTRTTFVMNLVAGYPRYDLSFDFYTIGSWDGRGKQAQNGIFLANVFDISYKCGTADPVSIFKTSFSNQLTVQQDYPNAFQLGGFKAATGSYGTDLLGYKTQTPPTSNTPVFRSFGDVEYTLTFAGANPCGTNAVQFIVSTSNPTQQSTYDESWGVDNIRIKAGT